ncbi:hypothetical protein PAEN110709_10655 [Paenibacillus endophyticus]
MAAVPSKGLFVYGLFIGAVLLVGESFCWVSVAAAPFIELGFVLIGFYFIDKTFGAFQCCSLLGCNCDIYYSH